MRLFQSDFKASTGSDPARPACPHSGGRRGWAQSHKVEGEGASARAEGLQDVLPDGGGPVLLDSRPPDAGLPAVVAAAPEVPDGVQHHLRVRLYRNTRGKHHQSHKGLTVDHSLNDSLIY